MAKVRIRDIAEIANVSIGTVDRVIHNRNGVSMATREKVRKLLAEYDYTPDIIASSLALKRDIHLAAVMPRVVNEHAFWKLPQKGIQRALDAVGHIPSCDRTSNLRLLLAGDVGHPLDIGAQMEGVLQTIVADLPVSGQHGHHLAVGRELGQASLQVAQ